MLFIKKNFICKESGTVTKVRFSDRVKHEWHKCTTSATLVTQVRHKCYTNGTSVTRVLHEWHEWDTSKKFWFWYGQE